MPTLNFGPRTPRTAYPDGILEVKASVSLAAPTEPWLTHLYSSYDKLCCVLAWIIRFSYNCRQSGEKHQLSLHLKLSEVRVAQLLLLKKSQEISFSEQLHTMKRNSELKRNDPLLPLRPFVDHEGVLRVGGRLSRSGLKFSQRHPAIMDRKEHLASLLVKNHHLSSCHAGPTLLLALVSRNHHILGGRRLVRDVCRKCIPCRKQNQAPAEQLMGQLPSSRVTPSNIFTIVGLDYAGPLIIKRGNPRKPVLVKAYLCVFVDFVVKAVHLEIVSDMTSEAFLAALKRFVSRRGRPRELHSDNGTNFVGANRELQDLCSVLRLKETQESICHYCLSNNIEWNFSSERAPNFGGLWEAVVKAAKTHLRKLMRTQKFTYEELATIVTQIEACLNSRPLTPINCADEDGLDVLTPGHFLIGRPLEAVPDQMDRPQTPSLLKKWNLCQAMAREFWYRWSSEYIRLLNKNNKWRRNQRNMQVNDIVLVKDH